MSFNEFYSKHKAKKKKDKTFWDYLICKMYEIKNEKNEKEYLIDPKLRLFPIQILDDDHYVYVYVLNEFAYHL
jgi:hypothetical protein